MLDTVVEVARLQKDQSSSDYRVPVIFGTMKGFEEDTIKSTIVNSYGKYFSAGDDEKLNIAQICDKLFKSYVADQSGLDEKSIYFVYRNFCGESTQDTKEPETDTRKVFRESEHFEELQKAIDLFKTSPDKEYAELNFASPRQMLYASLDDMAKAAAQMFAKSQLNLSTRLLFPFPKNHPFHHFAEVILEPDELRDYFNNKFRSLIVDFDHNIVLKLHTDPEEKPFIDPARTYMLDQLQGIDLVDEKYE